MSERRTVMQIAREIEAKRREQFRLLMELAVWEEVLAQIRPLGLGEEDVESFGFDAELLRPEVWSRAKKIAIEMYRTFTRGSYSETEPWIGFWLVCPGKPQWYNFVRLTSSYLVNLEPFVQSAESRKPSKT